MNEKYKFKAADFYEQLEEQKYRCPLTTFELTPENVTAEHKVPLQEGGVHERENIYLVDRTVAKIKRYTTEERLLEIAVAIVKTIGKKHGYSIRKSKK